MINVFTKTDSSEFKEFLKKRESFEQNSGAKEAEFFGIE
jgi:hypothetical protein